MQSPVSTDQRPVWGDGVRFWRGVRDLTQVQLAADAQTTQVTISAIERGRRNVSDDLRVRIARVLGVDPHDLFPYLDEHGNVA